MNSASRAQKKPVTLGTKIRQLRKRNKYTLAELAEQCNLSTSFLSQIERDQANPSVTTLYAIAKIFEVSVATLFEEDPQESELIPPIESIAKVTRSDHRKIIIYPGSGIRNEILSPDSQRAIQMLWVVMPPGTDSGESPFIQEGVECGIVLQGQIETRIGDELYILGPGDTIYHPSNVPHQTRNIGDSDAIMVVAKAPPSI